MRKSGVKKSHPRIYKAWQSMRQRCNNHNDKSFADYGGRGIRVCDEWNQSAAKFVEWSIANGYKDGLSLDRKDVNGNYCPENCRWATATQQARNKRIEKTNKTGANGVHMDRGKFRVTIYVDSKKVDLGRYKTLEEAVKARRNGEEKYWGVTA